MINKILLLTFMLSASGFVYSQECDKAKAFNVGLKAIQDAFPNYEKDAPYQIMEINGKWAVFGTLPEGWAGGTPEALVDTLTCEVIKVYHGQ